MKKLPKDKINRKGELSQKLQTVSSDLAQAVDDFNSELCELWNEKIKPALNDYNDVAGEVNEFIDEVYEFLKDYYDSKTEKWQDSENG